MFGSIAVKLLCKQKQVEAKIGPRFFDSFISGGDELTVGVGASHEWIGWLTGWLGGWMTGCGLLVQIFGCDAIVKSFWKHMKTQITTTQISYLNDDDDFVDDF